MLALLSLAVEAWRGGSVGTEAAQDARRQTTALVRAEVDGLLAEAQAQAAAVAALPETARALTEADAAPAIAALSRLRRPGPISIEVVDSTGAVVAWDGPEFPRLGGPPPDSLRTRVVADDASRRALVVWEPVHRDGHVFGAVRVARVVQARVPVRNRYLQDYDVADDWRAEAPVPFVVRFGERGEGEALRGPDGTALGTVDTFPASPQTLATIRRGEVRAVTAFWAVVLLGWLIAGLGGLFFEVVRRAERRPSRRRWAQALGALVVLWAGMAAARFGFLALDAPVRWLDGARRPAALFDPTLLASDLGWGALRSPGDLAITAALVLVAAGLGLLLVLRYVASLSGPARLDRRVVGWGGVVAAVAGGLALGGAWTERAVLDATLSYTDPVAALLDGPTLVVLAGLVAVLGAVVAAIAGAVLAARAGGGRSPWAVAVALALSTAAATSSLTSVPMAPALALAALGSGLAVTLFGRPERWAWPLTFRGVLVGALLLAPVLYGVMADPLRERTEVLLADAAFAFSDARDERVTAAIDQVFDEARADDALGPALLGALALADSARAAAAPLAADSSRRAVTALASGLVQNSLLGSLADVATELRIVSPAGDTLGGYVERGAVGGDDGLGYATIRTRYDDYDGRPRFLRLNVPVVERRGLRRTAVVGPIPDATGETVAWLYLRVTPRTARFPTETPFPRVLADGGLFGLDDEALGYAEYDDGVLVRQRGAAPLRLDPDVYQALSGRAVAYRRPEILDGRPSLAYYERQGEDAQDVVAVRAPMGDRLDVLFVLLRLSLAGLALGGVVFAVGIGVRRRAGLWPPERTRFRDKVLNRFLVVGLASVALTGVVGQRVIVEQNREAVRSDLRQRLNRASTVYATESEAEAGRLDAVSAALGVDVHLYTGAALEASSRRQLVRQRLIEPRLPGSVYAALYLDDQPFAFSDDRIGTFSYTTGYLALPDSSGRPAQALAIPTLSEQAAIEAGRSRYVAYLFGGLLALLAAILIIAVLLAGQLTRPFGRLREGLRRVGAGEADVPIPVETHDEVGELVESFNTMQRDLAESRRRLAEQEREVAWSTMARQVAHEIKNPLMPMKLSVQHLQRTFIAPNEEAPPEDRRFAGQFERTTGMLIDQIETLDRIASDFSRFARMPMRAPETLDLTAVAQEAAALFESPLAESDRVRFATDFADAPLPVVADREELRRVLVNLLTNALQAIPARPEGGHIALSTVLDAEGWAVAQVADDGSGIPDDVRDHVFQPSFSTKTSGMGLGLAISKRAVEAARGSIAFETSPDGTTFTVRLPLAPDEPE